MSDFIFHLPLGTILNDLYRIEKVLGQGGFGITYLATDMRLNRQVAIKEFFPKDFCNRNTSTGHVETSSQSTNDFIENLKHKFLKEARHIAGMCHPNIIPIFGAFEANDTAYYVMELIEGASLADVVLRNGKLTPGQALNYIAKIGYALEYIHSKRFTHLDVKPANIMLRQSDNEPILIDFGLSKRYDESGNQTSTTPTGISHGFAPIEQYQDGGVSEFSPRTDLYALAATFYYAVTGIVPPSASTLIETELMFPDDFPKALRKPVLKAMSPARPKRHPSIHAFVKDLLNPGDFKEPNSDEEKPDERQQDVKTASTNPLETEKRTANSNLQTYLAQHNSDAPLKTVSNKPPQKKKNSSLYSILAVVAVLGLGIVLYFSFFNETEQNDTVAEQVWVNRDASGSSENNDVAVDTVPAEETAPETPTEELPAAYEMDYTPLTHKLKGEIGGLNIEMEIKDVNEKILSARYRYPGSNSGWINLEVHNGYFENIVLFEEQNGKTIGQWQGELVYPEGIIEFTGDHINFIKDRTIPFSLYGEF